MFATSLSFGIQKLMAADNPLEAAKNILVVASTKALPYEYPRLLESYNHSYWRENPELAEQIFNVIVSNSAFIQPRLGGQAIPLHWSRSVWPSFNDYKEEIILNWDRVWELGWAYGFTKPPVEEVEDLGIMQWITHFNINEGIYHDH